MRLIFLGPPGAGKGTYSSRICEKEGWAHISTGDLLREEVRKATGLGVKAKEYMDSGKLVPDELVINMLKTRLKGDDCKKGFILDGFPRTREQAEALDSITRIDAVLNLRIPDWVLIEKILARRTCEKCGDIYNVADIRFGPNDEYHMPPMKPNVEGKCDKCGGKLVSRSDETEDVIKQRLETYRQQTEPLIKYYRDRRLLRNVDVTASSAVMVPKIMGILGI